VQRLLIALGVLFIVAGIAWPWIARLGLGRLPGDINVEREGWSFHFPIVTSIVISLVLTLLLWMFRK
jgi:ribose/xylose/arabinose/galactoside ABC-type transport system permease subunit